MIAIGDIHGCLPELREMVEALPADRELIFLGDYVDRGPDSRGVIEYLCRLAGTRKCVFLRGNHDQMMLDSYDGDSEWIYTWMANGGENTLGSYRLYAYSRPEMQNAIPAHHIEFLRATKIYHETEDFFFVHGGVKPDLSISHAKLGMGDQAFMWERNHLFAAERKWEKTVVCGHTIQDEPLVKDNLICIDTGAFLSYYRPEEGRLTAILLPEREIVQVTSGVPA